MGEITKIEWTDATWNPILGCSRISEGCRNCYAERIAGRFPNQPVYAGLTKIVNGHPHRSGLMVRAGKKHAGSLLDGKEWKQFPEAK